MVLLIGQITGVPIQIDWVSLDLAGMDVQRPIPTPSGWQSAGQLLEATAQAVGAELRPQPTVVEMTLTDANFQQTLAPLVDLQDFSDPPTAVAVLNDFLDDGPDAGADPDSDPGAEADPDGDRDGTDRPADGKGLRIGATRQQQQLAALAIESLRRMRGVPGKLSDDLLHRWAQPAGSQPSGWPVLSGGDPGPKFDTPITIAGLLRRTARRNQASCVINWLEPNRRAAPEQLVFPEPGPDAATMLRRTLSPWNLQVRVAGPSRWWVGSEATYDRLPALVWTQPLSAAQRERLEGRLAAIMQEASRDVFRITPDPQSDRVLMLLPRYIVRQLPKITAEY
jgi:hypothetical protein